MVRILVLSKNASDYLFRNQKIDYLSTKKTQPNTNFYYDILFKHITEENLTNTMLVLRAISNLFKSLESSMLLNTNKKLLAFLLNERSALMRKLYSISNLETNKGSQIAFSTVVLNYIILFKRLVGLNENFSATYITDMLFETLEYLNEPNLSSSILNWDAEAIFRMLVSIGTLVSSTDKAIDYNYLSTAAKSVGNFNLICKEISVKEQRYPEKVVKCANYLLKDLN